MQGGGVNGVHLARGRFRVGKDMAKMGVTALTAHFRALHIIRIVRSLDEEIFRDRFAERGQTDLAIKFIEGSEEWFARDHIDVDAGLVTIPKLILKRRFGSTLPDDIIFLRFQSVFQNGVARDRPVRIEACGLLFFFLREKEKVEPAGDEHDRDAGTDVRADRRFFLAGDSPPVHLIAMTLLNQKLAASVKTAVIRHPCDHAGTSTFVATLL